MFHTCMLLYISVPEIYTQCKGWKQTISKVDFSQGCTEFEVSNITVEFDSVVGKYFKQVFYV